MGDSDFCGDAACLAGLARLDGRWGLGVPIAADLPAYLDRTSRRAVHANPAGALNRGWSLSARFPAALTCRGEVRLVSGCRYFGAHYMWFIFITARLFIFLRFQPRLAALLWRLISVVNNPTRRTGLSPVFRSTSLAQPPAFSVDRAASLRLRQWLLRAMTCAAKYPCNPCNPWFTPSV
jgi:hypothetical protein